MQSSQTIIVKDFYQKSHEISVNPVSPVLDVLIQLKDKGTLQVVMGELVLQCNRRPINIYQTFKEQKIANRAIITLSMKNQRGIQTYYQFIYEGKEIPTFKTYHPCFPTIGQLKLKEARMANYLKQKFSDDNQRICSCINCQKFD